MPPKDLGSIVHFNTWHYSLKILALGAKVLALGAKVLALGTKVWALGIESTWAFAMRVSTLGTIH